MENENQKNIVIRIIVVLLIVLAIVAVFVLTKVNDLSNVDPDVVTENDDNDENEVNDSNTINNEDDVVDSNEGNNSNNDDNVNYVDSANDQYLWKMKVSNKNGANVYEYFNNSKILTNLPYNTIVEVVGDWYDHNSDEYYVKISYNSNKSSYEAYVKYLDLELIADSVKMLEFEENEYYIVSSAVKNIYSGPGMLFKQENEEINIPIGEILEVKYYNYFGTVQWLYVENDNYSTWILLKNDHSVNYPYDGYAEYSGGFLRKVSKTNGTINTGDVEIKLYSYDGEVLGSIPKNTELKYDMVADNGLGGAGIHHIVYDNQSAWIYASYVNSCDDYATGYLSVLEYDENSSSYVMCYNQKIK